MDKPVNYLCDSCWSKQKNVEEKVVCEHADQSPIYPTPEHPEGGYRVKGKPSGNILKALQQIFLSNEKARMSEDEDSITFYVAEEFRFGFEPHFEPMKEKKPEDDGDAGS